MLFFTDTACYAYRPFPLKLLHHMNQKKLIQVRNEVDSNFFAAPRDDFN